MNVSAPANNKIPWRRIIPIAVVLLIVGYQYSRPTLERWVGRPLPSLNENEQANSNDPSPSSRSSASSDRDYTAKLPQGTTKKKSGGLFKLKEVGRDRFESPAGLLYTMGGGGEHRIDHVMRHAVDMPNRPAHGVFVGGGDQDAVLGLIDDAYELVKAKSPKAKYEASRGNDLWDVDMGRKVGFDGGKKGKKNGGRSLNKVRMVLDGNRVITAFPVR